jgi:hypothetical protein
VAHGHFNGPAWHVHVGKLTWKPFLKYRSTNDVAQMLKHAGMLEAQPLLMLDTTGKAIETQHEEWISRESRNRYGRVQ